MELRRLDRVVVERPQGAVGEPAVEAAHLGPGQLDRHKCHALVHEGLARGPHVARPADPGHLAAKQSGHQRAHEATRAGLPCGFVAALDPVHRQPVRNNHQVELLLHGCSASSFDLARDSEPTPG
jgi:hypothetical protein